jgi:hypothetical protein
MRFGTNDRSADALECEGIDRSTIDPVFADITALLMLRRVTPLLPLINSVSPRHVAANFGSGALIEGRQSVPVIAFHP